MSECTHDWVGGETALNVSPPVRSWTCALCGEWGYSDDWAGTVKPMVPNPKLLGTEEFLNCLDTVLLREDR